MADSAPAKLAEILLQARVLPPADRAAFLRRACGNDEKLRTEAEARLADTDNEWWHRVDVFGGRGEEYAGTEVDWSRSEFGPYRGIRMLGRGGMGEVVLAERSDQFRQRVAIKLVRRGLLSRHARVRLLIERQILANLNHPNIARLLDGGALADGTPYIVMEYVAGDPIDVYCDKNRLTLQQRLRLFQKVCAAVHLAHQNLIVHRDLKPSNILVTEDGVPKLLDFGIAKLLDEQASPHTVAVTQENIRLMTPDHASPEQIQGLPLTTASDTYALGVLLYELLSGHRPYKLDTLHFGDIARVVCDEPVNPPSVFFVNTGGKQSTQHLENLAEKRAVSVAKLARELRGDLGTIVLMAMRKEPERRYASTERFAADIERFLNGLPVTARADSWRYRVGKFCQRHKFGVAASVLATVSLIGFTLVTVIQATRIARERERAEQVSSFLVNMFDFADPDHNRGNEITIREALDIGTRRMSTGLVKQPEIRATLLTTVGSVYGSLGLYDESTQLLKDALQIREQQFGPKHPDAVDSMQRLGNALMLGGNLKDAEPLLLQSLALNRQLFDAKSLVVGESLHSLAKLRQIQERFADSAALYLEALAIFDAFGHAADEKKAALLSDYAALLVYQGDFTAAEAMYRNALAVGKEALGDDHPLIASTTNDLAVSLKSQGRTTEAEPLFEDALNRIRAIYGARHPKSIDALENYASFLHRSNQLDRAETVLREVIALDEVVRGPRHLDVGYTRVSLGRVLYDKKQYENAETEFRLALEIYREALPDNHLYIVACRTGLGRTLLALGRNSDAETELTKALKIARIALPDDNPQVAAVSGALGRAIAVQGRYAEAAPILRSSYATLLRAQGANDPTTTAVRGWTEDLYQRWGRPEEAQHFFASLNSPAATETTTANK